MAGIYIHIPFCVAKCRYCDFVSFPCEKGEKTAYTNALIKEMEMNSAEYRGKVFNTVFIGGGTPSTLPQGEIGRIMAALKNAFAISETAEITIEANPGTLSHEKLEEYKFCGINRLSMGLQSAQPNILKALGRIHSAEDFATGMALAKQVGFANINADLMYGLPEQTAEDFLDSIRYAALNGVTHISAYSLIVEENTPLYFDINGGAVLLPGEDEAFEMYSKGKALLERLGYHRYEISNYAKNGFCSAHNINYWDNGEYLGLGLNSHSAMSKNGKWQRWANIADFDKYINAVNNGLLPTEGDVQHIDKNEEMFECVMLGLRKTEGINAAAFEKRFNQSIYDVFAKAIAKLDEDGLMVRYEAGIRLNDRGLDIENIALMPFMD